MSKFTLSLVIHNHQPAGNFDHIFAKATERAYAPLLKALEQHPSIRLAIHYTGPLLGWMLSNRSEHLERLRGLIEREQIEILTGAYYEPILVAIPDADKIGQIEKMTRFLQQQFGHQPTGAWIAERVWEPYLPKPLSEAGVQYTLLDDTPFKMAGLTEDELFGAYVTEEQGYTLKVFSTVTYLRYAIPWHPVKQVIDWLREQAQLHPNGVAVMGDDGEKFGFWPGTHKHCWGEDGWMERFFTALEDNADWLQTSPPGEIAATEETWGRVYLPSASYNEMMLWALPPDNYVDFERVQRELQEQKRQDILRFLKGGYWRSFMTRYHEINQMHKKMLWVSRKVHQMPDGVEKKEALDHVWAAQCNCGYWHGLFGGIHLFHIRAANYAHLIAAEELADRAATGSSTWRQVERSDFDADGHEDLIINTDQQVLMFKPSYGGALVEWDWRERRYNLLNVMTRYREGYHQKLRRAAEQGRLILPSQEEIPKGVRVRESDVHRSLFYDWHRRAALLDHFLHHDTTPEAFYQARYGEQGDFVNQPYTARVEEKNDTLQIIMTRNGTVWAGKVPIPVHIKKVISMHRDEQPGKDSPYGLGFQVDYKVVNLNDIPVALRFGVEFDWGIIGGDSHYGKFNIPGCPLPEESHEKDRRIPNDFGGCNGISQMTIGSTLPDLAGEIDLTTDRPAYLWHFPLEAVSNSQAGYERIYQGTCTLLWWEAALEPKRPWKVRLDLALNKVDPR